MDRSELDSGDPVGHTETGRVDHTETGRVDRAKTSHEDHTVTSHKGCKGGDLDHPDLNAYMMQNMETYLALIVVCYVYSQYGCWNLPS